MSKKRRRSEKRRNKNKIWISLTQIKTRVTVNGVLFSWFVMLSALRPKITTFSPEQRLPMVARSSCCTGFFGQHSVKGPPIRLDPAWPPWSLPELFRNTQEKKMLLETQIAIEPFKLSVFITNHSPSTYIWKLIWSLNFEKPNFTIVGVMMLCIIESWVIQMA